MEEADAERGNLPTATSFGPPLAFPHDDWWRSAAKPAGHRIAVLDQAENGLAQRILTASSDQHSLRDDSLTVAPIRSLRKALISQPALAELDCRNVKTSRIPCDQQGEEAGGQGEHGRWPSRANMQPASSISSTVNGPQPTLDGRRRDAASHRRLARPMAAKLTGEADWEPPA
jgi:hypothetical protein